MRSLHGRYPLIVLIGLLSVTILPFLGGIAHQAEPLTIRDNLNRSIQFLKPPTRVISLAPSITEMLFALGLVVPHAVRLMLGADHRLLFPVSVLVGGMFVLLMDTAARTLLAPRRFRWTSSRPRRRTLLCLFVDAEKRNAVMTVGWDGLVPGPLTGHMGYGTQSGREYRENRQRRGRWCKAITVPPL